MGQEKGRGEGEQRVKIPKARIHCVYFSLCYIITTASHTLHARICVWRFPITFVHTWYKRETHSHACVLKRFYQYRIWPFILTVELNEHTTTDAYWMSVVFIKERTFPGWKSKYWRSLYSFEIEFLFYFIFFR